MRSNGAAAPSREWGGRGALLLLLATAGAIAGAVIGADAPSAPATNEAAAATNETAAATNAPVAGSYVPAGGWGRPKGQLSARLSAQYDYRSQGDATDQDLYGYLYANGRELADGRVDFYASARLHRDLDPTSVADTDPFRSLDDSRGVEDERLQQLYVDLHDRDGRLSLRGGRQYIDAADYLHLDGGQVSLFEGGKFGGAAYLGRPVSYYTSVSGDVAGGLSLQGRPWEGNLTRLTFARYYEDREDAGDQNYFLDFRQKLTEEARVRSQVSFLNGDYRMGSLDGFYVSKDGETDLSLGASYWGTFDARTRAYSPLYSVLGSQQPYTYAYGRLTQQLTPTFALSPGVSLRFAEGDGNEFNNRDYQNYDLAFIYAPVRSVSGSVSLQYWNVDRGDSFVGVSWDVRYRHRRLWEVSAGTSFAQYSYDTVSDISYSANGGQTVFSENGTVVEQTPYVYTYFLRAKWNVTRKLALRAQFDLEDNDATPDLAFRGRATVEVRY